MFAILYHLLDVEDVICEMGKMPGENFDDKWMYTLMNHDLAVDHSVQPSIVYPGVK